MKIKFASLCFLALLSSFYACNSNDDLPTTAATSKAPNKVVDVTHHDGRPFSTGNTMQNAQGRYVANPGGGVMMQGFYWDCPSGGNWWNTVTSKLTVWSNAGIGSVWLPPVSKGQNGGFSMGYDPCDYFDFGNYNQNGSTETRFGSRTELQALITKAHTENMQVFADIVINHCSGGQSEYNSFTGGNTWTNFTGVASGKFKRTYNDFYKNAYGAYDEGSFGGYPDLCHLAPNVKDWLWLRADGVGKYYKNTMKFDGWRFDYVKGFNASVVNQWNANVGGFSVGEYWDANVDLLSSWANSANSSVFDFA